MNLPKIILSAGILLQHLNNDNVQIIKKHSIDKLKKLRTRGSFRYYLMRLYLNYKTKNKHHNIGNGRQLPISLLSPIISYEEGIDIYLEDLVSQIPIWNSLPTANNDTRTTNEFVYFECEPERNLLIPTKNTLQFNCYLANSVGKLYRSTGNKLYLKHYTRLLSGIAKCLTGEGSFNKILDSPTTSRNIAKYTISLGCISGLTLLISNFNKTDSSDTTTVEANLKVKYNLIMHNNDYIIDYGSEESIIYDLKPNILYNHLTCFAYIATRLSQNELSDTDVSIFKNMIKSMVPELDTPGTRNNIDFISSANLLEAILNMYKCVTDDDILNIMCYDEFLDLSVLWLLYYRSASPAFNPEIEAVLFVFCSEMGDAAGKERFSVSAQRVINILYQNNTLTKTPNGKLGYPDIDNVATIYVGKYTPFPPLYRANTQNYWCDSPYVKNSTMSTFPVFEYLYVYARIYDYLKKQ